MRPIYHSCMYNFDKENDKDFLREVSKVLHDRVILLEIELSQIKKRSEKDAEIFQKLSEELKVLRQRFFDSKQERKKTTPKKKRKQSKLPHNQSNNTPQVDEEITLDEKIIDYKLDQIRCDKCGADDLNEMKNCFEESSEIEVIERKYIINRHQRQKYSCKCCHNITTAPGGVKLTTGGEYSIQMATQIVSDKFQDHIPLERQRKQMYRAGLAVEVKTLFGLTEHLYNRLRPLEKMIKKDVLGEKWVHIDESPFDFYNPNKSKGYVWSISNPRGAYYQFEPTRSGSIAKEMLQGFKGNVVTDGFSGYNFIGADENLKQCFCWAHVRRKFFEAMRDHPKAEIIVDLIDELYDIEHEAEEIKNLQDLRSMKSAQIIKKIDEWMDLLEGKYLETSLIGKAINYYLERKKGLHEFLYDEYVPIDNNMAERRQRCPVMGRKNFLSFKSINGADIGVFFYSVIESCKSNGIDPRSYMNEMAHKSATKKLLESPYQYATRLQQEVRENIARELLAIKNTSS